ncbi:MAG: hypothetical protein OXT73_05670 [Bacteroidota bacterium]|nr:hypothetical protein [Bacteroidota bacterium]
MRLVRQPLLLWIFLAITLTGCLPSSCNRVEPRTISPADSLSRALAETMSVDTLQLVSSTPVDRDDFRSPRTVQFFGENGLVVTDTRSHTLHYLSASDSVVRSIELPGSIPYLAGVEGDSVWVFAPGDGSVRLFVDGEQRDSLGVDLGSGNERALTWLVRVDSGFVSKVLDDDSGNHLGFHDTSGTMLHRIELPAASWRYAGFLRPDEGRLLSLAGFLPWIYTVEDGKLDSLRLNGYDSPMLARTLQFELGTTEQPPLLSAAADPAGEWLFLLNMRPGWLHVDVYDRTATLRYILTQPDPSFDTDFYPSDLAVRETAPGAFELVVTVTEPETRVDRYRWTMPGSVTP